MKKRIGIAVVLALALLAGAVWAEREVLPTIRLTEKILVEVVNTLAFQVKDLDPAENASYSLLQAATNAYRVEVRAAIRGDYSPWLPQQPALPDPGKAEYLQEVLRYFKDLTQYNKDLGARKDALDENADSSFANYLEGLAGRMKTDTAVGLIAVLPFWYDRAVAAVEAEGATEALIPLLQESHNYLLGKGVPPAKAKLLAERLRMSKAEEPDDKVSKFQEDNGLTQREITQYEWVERQREKTGDPAIKMIARGVQELLNRLKALEAKKKQLLPAPRPTAAAPAQAAPALSEKAAAGDGGAKPVKRW
jgi:hypothetical protein